METIFFFVKATVNTRKFVHEDLSILSKTSPAVSTNFMKNKLATFFDSGSAPFYPWVHFQV